MKRYIGLLSLSMAINTAFADDRIIWGLSGSVGMTHYAEAYAHDGKSALGRLGLEVNYLLNELFQAGIEGGIQNGNRMRLNVPKSVLDDLGGEPIHITLKPTIDLLATLKLAPMDSCLMGFIKGGVAYQQLQVDRNEVNDVSQMTPELQAGVGFHFLDTSALLFAGYQHLFGQAAGFEINPMTERGYIRHIPAQSTVFIGASIRFG